MSWLFKQIWVWILIAFLLGLILTWIYVVRGPSRRDADMLEDAGTAPADTGGDGNAADETAADDADEQDSDEQPESAAAASADQDVPAQQPDLPNEQESMGALDVSPTIIHEDGGEGHQRQPAPDANDLPQAGKAETVAPEQGQVTPTTPGSEPAATAETAPDAPASDPSDVTEMDDAPGVAAPEEPAVDEMAEAEASTDAEPDPITEQFGAGAASPRADGSAPSAAFTIKGDAETMMFHTPDSPSFDDVEAEIWFKDEAAAASAGFLPARR